MTTRRLAAYAAECLRHIRSTEELTDAEFLQVCHMIRDLTDEALLDLVGHEPGDLAEAGCRKDGQLAGA
jgi:hypothetical protein